MSAIRRITSATLALALTSLIGGCAALNTPSLDPTDLLDFLDTKKPAPGVRKPVFPDGVPGISQGVPPDLVKGTPEHAAAMAIADPSLAPPPAEPPPPIEAEKPQPKSKKRVAAKPSQITPDSADAGAADTEVPPPATPPRKRVAKKPPPPPDPDAQQDQSEQAPAAQSPRQGQATISGSGAPTVPSGSFQR